MRDIRASQKLDNTWDKESGGQEWICQWIDVHECLGCQIVGPNPPLQPLNMTNPPKQVRHTIYVDYLGPFPSGEYLFVAVDETSKYPEVCITHSSTAATATQLLNHIFAMHRLSEVITSHNVPFGSGEFTAWCNHMGLKHRKITPQCPGREI